MYAPREPPVSSLDGNSGTPAEVCPKKALCPKPQCHGWVQTRVEKRKKVQCDHTDAELGKRVLCALQG